MPEQAGYSAESATFIMVPDAAGFLIAFLAALIATLLDGYFTMAKSLPRVPGMIIIHPAIVGLAVLCGLCAVAAFAFTDPSGNDVISTAITLKQTNPLLRGFAVGAMVLVLLRSKLFNVQDSGLGGEAIYTLLRSLALQAVNDTRTNQRTKFLNANISAAFAIPTYFTQLESTIIVAMKLRPPELQQRAADEVKAVKANIPATQMAQNDVAWNNYYLSATGICFDYCGPSVLTTFPGFKQK